MKITNLLNKIANGEIENDSIFYVNGDFFYNLIVVDGDLYVINTRTKQLTLLESHIIGRFIEANIVLYEYKMIIN